MSKLMLVLIAMFATATAQVLLKKASYYDVKTAWWLTYFGVSAVIYGLSFLLYAIILKYYPLNKIYPIMTVGQIMLVTFYGVFIGEAIDIRHALGLVCGVFAIYLILS